jgi:hypothetical protein
MDKNIIEQLNDRVDALEEKIDRMIDLLEMSHEFEDEDYEDAEYEDENDWGSDNNDDDDSEYEDENEWDSEDEDDK